MHFICLELLEDVGIDLFIPVNFYWEIVVLLLQLLMWPVCLRERRLQLDDFRGLLLDYQIQAVIRVLDLLIQAIDLHLLLGNCVLESLIVELVYVFILLAKLLQALNLFLQALNDFVIMLDLLLAGQVQFLQLRDLWLKNFRFIQASILGWRLRAVLDIAELVVDYIPLNLVVFPDPDSLLADQLIVWDTLQR